MKLALRICLLVMSEATAFGIALIQVVQDPHEDPHATYVWGGIGLAILFSLVGGSNSESHKHPD